MLVATTVALQLAHRPALALGSLGSRSLSESGQEALVNLAGWLSRVSAKQVLPHQGNACFVQLKRKPQIRDSQCFLRHVHAPK
ncbi:MAG: hypothetical protein HY901_27280 [Deltaproteobacteria bacterium]|nr:hypothetical protein [Deltaproteobacteria bacterium]